MVTRAHVLAWRKDLEARALSGATIRRKLAALSSLFEHLCEANAVSGNPVKGVKRPRVNSREGKTPAIRDHQARSLLDEPHLSTLQGLRDRAIPASLLYHGLRRAELCALTVGDLQLDPFKTNKVISPTRNPEEDMKSSTMAGQSLKPGTESTVRWTEIGMFVILLASMRSMRWTGRYSR